MKRFLVFLTTLTASFLVVSASQVLAACEYNDTTGCSKATETDCVPIGGGGFTKRTRLGPANCLENNKTCEERFGDGYYCLLIENWSEDCGGCTGQPQTTCEDLGGECVPWCAHTRCTKAIGGGCPDGEYCCDMACHEEEVRKNYCVPYNGACMSTDACAGGHCCTARRDWPDCDSGTTPDICCCDIDNCLDYSCAKVGNCVPEASCAPGEEILPSDPPGKWPDCSALAGETCCKPGGVTKCQGPDGLGGLCMIGAACVPPNQIAPRPAQGFWDDCFIPGTTTPDHNRDCCIPAKADNSCYRQGGVCTKKSKCDPSSQIPRPGGDWVEEACKASNGGVCCGVNAGELDCERNVKDPDRGKVACGRFFLVQTKKWSSTHPTEELAKAARGAIDFETLYDFTGTITLGKIDQDTDGEFTWPIKGDLPRLVGYFPDYKNADGTYSSPPVINGAKDLANYNFSPSELFRWVPPADADALAAWLPILYKTYAHYTVPIEMECINSRLPGEDGVDKDGNPEIHGAVRYTYGLWKAMHNYETKTGIWDWIARKPGESEKDVMDWAKSLASTKAAPQSMATAEKNLLGSFVSAQDNTPQTTTLVTAREAGVVLGSSTTNRSCGYPPCDRDARSAPEYDEGCVWFNGEARLGGGVENVHITRNNSNPKITENTDLLGNPIFTLSYSHTVKVGPIKIDVKEGYLNNYWPLKLNFFMNLIPKEAQEDYIFNPPEEAGCKDSCENSWGNADLFYTADSDDANTASKVVSVDITDGGGNLEYLHGSGWAETAEELVIGRQSESVLGVNTTGTGRGKVLGAAVGGPGFAIPPSWAELYLPIILKDWGE